MLNQPNISKKNAENRLRNFCSMDKKSPDIHNNYVMVMKNSEIKAQLRGGIW